MANLKYYKYLNAKGQLFVIDGMLALAFIGMLLLLSFSENGFAEKNNKLLKIQKINDLLITSQYLENEDIGELKKNYLLLFPNTCGHIKINSDTKEINCASLEKTNFISNSIKYINKSNNKIYIEIGIYEK